MSAEAAPVSPLLLPLPSEIVGERLTLRPLRRGDGAELFAVVDRSRDHLRRFLPWVDKTQGVDDCEITARRLGAKWILREDLVLSIRLRGSDRLIGGTGLHRFDFDVRSFEVGYWIEKASEGKGYVQEAVRLVAALAVRRLEARHVRIHCDATNERSARVPRALGFTDEARLRCNTTTPTGEVRDTLVFGLTADEFAAQPWSAAAIAAIDAADSEG